MGWSLFSQKEDNKPANREERELCWESRDLFFGCLDKNNIIDARDSKNKKNINSNCSNELKNFEKNCSNSWIQYFKEKRIVDYKKKKIEEEMEKNGITPINLSPQQFKSMQNDGKK